MGQQQLVPEPQDKSERTASSSNNEGIYQQPYKLAKSKYGDGPKNEHPSTFEESIPPHSYRAQDGVMNSYHANDPAYTAHLHETDVQARQQRRRHFSPDGDALENGYRPYQQQQQMHYQVPSWARPQQQNRPPLLRWAIMLIVGIVFIKPLLAIIGTLFLAGLSVMAFIILIPLLLLSALLIAAVVFGKTIWRGGWRW